MASMMAAAIIRFGIGIPGIIPGIITRRIPVGRGKYRNGRIVNGCIPGIPISPGKIKSHIKIMGRIIGYPVMPGRLVIPGIVPMGPAYRKIKTDPGIWIVINRLVMNIERLIIIVIFVDDNLLRLLRVIIPFFRVSFVIISVFIAIRGAIVIGGIISFLVLLFIDNFIRFRRFAKLGITSREKKQGRKTDDKNKG
jgi:hypothetical protein